MNIFVVVLILTTVFAIVFRDDKKKFTIATALLHILVCGLRSDTVHGDLSVYKRGFFEFANAGWFSNQIISNGRNTLFYAFNKLIANLTGNSFQILLFIIAVISIISLSIIIYKYSEIPYVSFMVWNCFGFFIFNCYSIKQSMAMAFVLLASIGIFEKRRILFYTCTVLAGMIHLPAFVFIPAYELCKAQKLRTIIYFYIILAVTIILFRNRIIENITDFYYESEKYAAVSSYTVGGRTLLYIALLIVGVFLCNIKYERFKYVLILIATASLLQMFSVYGNVFTRLADYYFQFIILYAPLILKQPYENNGEIPLINFNKRSRLILMIGFLGLAFMFYYRVDLTGKNVGIANNVVANYKFFWQ